MEPIIFSKYGETIVVPEFIPEGAFLGMVSFSPLGFGVIGTYNGEEVCIASVSDHCWRVFCTHFALAIMVPKEVKTYGDLRQWCAEQIQKEKDAEIAYRDLKLKVGILFGYPDANWADRFRLLGEARARADSILPKKVDDSGTELDKIKP